MPSTWGHSNICWVSKFLWKSNGNLSFISLCSIQLSSRYVDAGCKTLAWKRSPINRKSRMLALPPSTNPQGTQRLQNSLSAFMARYMGESPDWALAISPARVWGSDTWITDLLFSSFMTLYKLFTSLSFSIFIWKTKYCLPLRMVLKIRGVDKYQVLSQ